MTRPDFNEWRADNADKHRALWEKKRKEAKGIDGNITIETMQAVEYCTEFNLDPMQMIQDASGKAVVDILENS